MTQVLPVFVYGTLREGEANAAVLDGHVVGRTPATLPGHRLHRLEYPCVIEEGDDPAPTPTPPGVRGELVVLEPSSYDAAIELLDWFEGFDPADVAGSLYERVLATVESEAGASACWVYVAGTQLRLRLDADTLIASGDWSAC